MFVCPSVSVSSESHYLTDMYLGHACINMHICNNCIGVIICLNCNCLNTVTPLLYNISSLLCSLSGSRVNWVKFPDRCIMFGFTTVGWKVKMRPGPTVQLSHLHLAWRTSSWHELENGGFVFVQEERVVKLHLRGVSSATERPLSQQEPCVRHGRDTRHDALHRSAFCGLQFRLRLMPEWQCISFQWLLWLGTRDVGVPVFPSVAEEEVRLWIKIHKGLENVIFISSGCHTGCTSENSDVSSASSSDCSMRWMLWQQTEQCSTVWDQNEENIVLMLIWTLI